MENLSCTSVDCLVVGAGPAGLAATLYLRRFHRQVMLADSGLSRAMRIDRSHNMPGFPEGISGKALLVRLRKQVAEAKGAVTRAEVSALARDGENGFTAIVGGRPVSARQVVLATGVVDREPPLPGLPSVRRRGLLRHCPVCDGYEHSGQRILVLGDGAHARAEARFLSHYSRHVTLVGVEAPATNAEPAERPSTAVLNSMVQRVGLRPEGGLAVQLQDGTRHPFDVMYMA
ncbi:MAG TPA: NAD(P)/FAD-dependent oxidoreductase, partial [Burkholderiaceae bacterium]|nr:NAD(P)/FAD-dependent oxidoreductase [Burkholderiaceae bacterium]